MRPQKVEQLDPTVGCEFGPGPLADDLERCHRPPPVIRRVGREFAVRFEGKPLLPFRGIEGNDRGAATALLSLCIAVGAMEVVVCRLHEERPEPSLVLLHPRDGATREQIREEFLGQVPGQFHIISTAADVGVQGIPVGPTERRQGLRRGCRRGPACRDHETPMSGREDPLRSRLVPSRGRHIPGNRPLRLHAQAPPQDVIQPGRISELWAERGLLSASGRGREGHVRTSPRGARGFTEAA